MPRKPITVINLSFTTFCNMRCPDCCCDITAKPTSDKSFYDYDYFINVAKHVYGINRIHLTGGEPTIHPNFKLYAAEFRNLFGCKLLTLETNGWGFKRFPEAFVYFDDIYISHYTSKSFVGAPDNSNEINFILDFYKNSNLPRFHVGEITHISRLKRGNKMCYRGYSENVAICDGLVFPCCVGPGVYPRNAVKIGPNWRDDILSIVPPCENCFFAEHDESFGV